MTKTFEPHQFDLSEQRWPLDPIYVIQQRLAYEEQLEEALSDIARQGAIAFRRAVDYQVHRQDMQLLERLIMEPIP